MFAINRAVYAGTGRFDADKRFRHQKTENTKEGALAGIGFEPSCRFAIVRGNLVLPRMPRIFGQNGSYQRPCRGILVPRLQPAFTIARRSDFR